MGRGLRRVRRIALILLVGAPLLLLAGDVLLWRLAEQRLQQGFAAWQQARREEGWTLRNGLPAAGGWPGAATLTLPDVVLTGGEADLPGGISWQAGQVTLTVALLHPRVLRVQAAGRQALRLGALPAVQYMAGSTQAAVPLQPGAAAAPPAIEMQAVQVGVPAVGPGTARVARLRADFIPPASGAGGFGFTLRAEAIALPATQRWPLGPNVDSLDLTGSLQGRVPQTASGLRARAAAWRDDGGMVVLRRIGLVWGKLEVSASARLTLDATLQPMGAARARVTDYAAALDAMVAAHRIGAHMATAIKAVLGLMAAAPSGGGPGEVEVPLTLQDRVVSMGRIPLARVPELVWPQS
ncbi:MAG TPA: DUF2125 domain-containing protein [Acetobacteraceae bacterium]|nr:DUF2125 domain-containing protein [Acetobacteraceae bacterium]